MKLIVVFLTLLSFAHANDLQAQRVELFFRETSAAVIAELSDSPIDLQSVIRNGTVEVTDRELVDNGGSLVDAIGVPGKVVLAKSRWLLFLREQRDVRLLVLHELLRMGGVNDDNFRVSRSLLPETTSGEKRFYCDLRVASTVSVEETRSMNSRGFNSPSSDAYDSAVSDLAQRCQARGYPQSRVSSAALSMRSTNTNGYNVVRNEVVMRGVCVRTATRQRPVADQRREGCRKAALCADLVTEGHAQLQAVDAQELEQVQRQWRCQ